MGERLKLMSLAAAIVLPLVGAVWTLGEGHRERVELDPETLEFRSVRSYELPLFQARVSPEWVDAIDSPLGTYLRDNGWLPTGDDLRGRKAPDSGWVAARGWSSGQPVAIGPGAALHQAFCERAGEWVAWSQANPRLAARLWPRVVLAVRAGRPHEAGAILRDARPLDHD